MSDLATTEMTEQEARHALSQFRGTIERQRSILLEMYKHKAHHALGYTSWEEFAELELERSYRSFAQLVLAGRVEEIVLRKTKVKDPLKAIATGTQDAVYLQLARLRDPVSKELDEDLIVKAWEEAYHSRTHVAQKGPDSRWNGMVTGSLMKAKIDSILTPAPDRSKPKQKQIETQQQEAEPEDDGFVIDLGTITIPQVGQLNNTGLIDSQSDHMGNANHIGYCTSDETEPSIYVAPEQQKAFEIIQNYGTMENYMAEMTKPPESTGLYEATVHFDVNADMRETVTPEWKEVQSSPYQQMAGRVERQSIHYNVRSCEIVRDDEKGCLVSTSKLPDGSLVTVWHPYGMLPVEFQP